MSELAVFDTNVLISYFWTLTKTTAVQVAVDKILTHKVTPVYSRPIMEEYAEVLNRAVFNFPRHKVRTFLKFIRENGLYVDPLPTTLPFGDISDKPFYDAARAAGAWLVTGNVRHYPQEGFIVSPREYLERVRH